MRWPWKEVPRESYPPVALNDQEANIGKIFRSNRIRSTKYRPWTFIPKSLFEQFRRIANTYFLIVAIISSIPSISPVSPFSSWLPLLFVLSVSAIKDLVEDLNRFKSDIEVNGRKYPVLRDGIFVNVQSKDINVGDIIRVDRNKEVPADILIMFTSNPEGVAYVDTANLDGETNLKQYRSRPETSNLTVETIVTFKGTVELGLNTSNLHKFQGNIQILGMPNKISLNEKNLLLRGTRIRNIEYAYGGVLYAGKDTKVQLNSNNPPSKFSRTERFINKVIVAIFCFKILACTGFAISNTLFERGYTQDSPYFIFPESSYITRGFLTFWSYFAIFSYFIPISLIVTLEISKLFQAIFMMWDVKMMDLETGNGMIVQNSDLNDELARVSYLFCDKTGTLTQNKMELSKAIIEGKSYEKIRDGELAAIVNRGGAESEKVLDYLIHLALTNTSIVDKLDILNRSEDSSEQDSNSVELSLQGTVEAEPETCCGIPILTEINYQSESPEEICFSKFARDNNVALKDRVNDSAILQIFGVEKKYTILHTFEFTSERSRMSVIVRSPEGKIYLYSKGSDNVMMKRISPEADPNYIKKTQSYIDKYSETGLRTLVCCQRILEENEYAEIERELLDAMNLIEGRDEVLSGIYDKIERNYELLGCTGIEDKLQEGVPESIAYFIAADLKVLIITGDKQATAINIARACNLIQPGVHLIIINSSDLDDCTLLLDRALKDLEYYPRCALVIDGTSLPFAFSAGQRLLNLTTRCEAAVFCRIAPLQKALIVRMVKNGTDKLTLSIGDGANDISMLQEAHIGVGLFGKEGSQAARSGDYALFRYKDLQRLICIHGRYNLVRSSSLILYCFYKNLATFLVMLWFSFYNGFSGQIIYNSFIMATFNVFLTFLPPFIMGIYERDVRERIIDKYPQAHREIHKGDGAFNKKSFMFIVLFAIWHSFVGFFIPLLLTGNSISHDNGRSVDISVYGSLTFAGVYFTVILKAALITRWWTWVSHVATWGSLVMYILILAIESNFLIYLPDQYYLINELFGSLTNIFCIFLVPFVSLLPDIFYEYVERNYFPSNSHVLQELSKNDHHKKVKSFAYLDKKTYEKFRKLHFKPPNFKAIERTQYMDDTFDDWKRSIRSRMRYESRRELHKHAKSS